MEVQKHFCEYYKQNRSGGKTKKSVCVRLCGRWAASPPGEAWDLEPESKAGIQHKAAAREQVSKSGQK